MKTTRFFERLKLGLWRHVDTTEATPGLQGTIQCDGMGRPLVGGSLGAVASPVYFEQASPVAPLTAADMNIAGGTLGTPIVFRLAPPPTQMWRIFGINITLAATSFDMTDFGGITGGLTNGIEMVGRVNGTTVMNITPVGYPIKTNPGMVQFATSGPSIVFFAPGSAVMSLFLDMRLTRQTFPELDGSSLVDLAILVKDDLSTLSRMRALAYREVVTL